LKKKKLNIPFISVKKEIDEQEDTTPNIKYYFKLLWRKFPRLLSVNLMMIFQILPIVIALIAYFLLMPRMFVYTDTLHPTLVGINTIAQSPISNSLLNIYGISVEVPTIAFGGAAITVIVCFVFLMITFGWQNVGAAYLTRELVRGRPVFVWSDYFYAVKRNFKQAFWIGIIDFLVCSVLIYDFVQFYNMTGNLGLDLMFWCICGVSVIYMFIRFYIYLLLINFDLKTVKIFKNALIFTALGFKRNILALVWLIVVIAVNVVLILVFLPMNIIIPLILPFLYLSAFALFTTTYAAYPVIKKYMIDPYYDEYGNPKGQSAAVETSSEENAENGMPETE